jgi:phosphoribosyl 1,2-cyclic phosphodiesterase
VFYFPTFQNYNSGCYLCYTIQEKAYIIPTFDILISDIYYLVPFADHLLLTNEFYDCYFSFFAYIMSILIASLNSGSNGNCYYIGNHREAVLIDAGLSCRETEKRLARLGLSFKKIRAIFISHEHADHIKGAEVISRKHQIPVYISDAAYQHSRMKLDETLVKHLNTYEPVAVGGLVVNAFPKQHDASEPHSFTVTGGEVTVGVLTDIGAVCEHVIQNFRLCHAAFLETNYDEVMLEEGSYPAYLKRRIRGDHGHLSNHQALELFSSHKSPFLSHLLLSHLSRDNNNPELALDLFLKHAGGTHIAVASRYKESEVHCINGDVQVKPGTAKTQTAIPLQMSLF